MVIIVTVIHILVSLGLILVVLLQTGKGAEIGAVFGGGSSSTIFGSSGAGTFLTKLTTGMAIVFMMTSLTLGYFAGHKPSGSIFDTRTPVATPRPPTPSALPAQNPQAGPASGQEKTPTQAPPQQTRPQK
jgi:preprotein translocase subunit SecG